MGELDFLSISNFNFVNYIRYTGSKNPFRHLDKKLDFSNIFTPINFAASKQNEIEFSVQFNLLWESLNQKENNVI